MHILHASTRVAAKENYKSYEMLLTNCTARLQAGQQIGLPRSFDVNLRRNILLRSILAGLHRKQAFDCDVPT